jgi:2-methylcitrate dehydratase PrpD
LSTDATAHAIALACATAPLASVRKTVYGGSGVTWVKNNMGIAAAGAVSAALLAREGARGPLDVWDGEQGFGRMIGTDRWVPDAAAADLGSTWYVDRLGFKAYPCCRHAHAVVDAALAARAELGVSADAIERVAVAGPVWIHHAPFDNPAPETMHDAQYSLPFILAVALLGAPPGLPWFEPTIYTRAHVRALAARVEAEPQPSPRARVTILARGRSATAEVDAPRGSPRAPMQESELRTKFESLVEPFLARAGAGRLYDVLVRIDRAPAAWQWMADVPGVDIGDHVRASTRRGAGALPL